MGTREKRRFRGRFLRRTVAASEWCTGYFHCLLSVGQVTLTSASCRCFIEMGHFDISRKSDLFVLKSLSYKQQHTWSPHPYPPPLLLSFAVNNAFSSRETKAIDICDLTQASPGVPLPRPAPWHSPELSSHTTRLSGNTPAASACLRPKPRWRRRIEREWLFLLCVWLVPERCTDGNYERPAVR